jgi:hypothetical protein
MKADDLARTREIARKKWISFLKDSDNGFRQAQATWPGRRLSIAFDRYRSGHRFALIKFLLTDPLSPPRRRHLARLLLSLNERPKGGRPLDRQVRQAVDEVHLFLHFWRSENWRQGVSERRKKERMTSEAIDLVAEGLGIPGKAEKIRNRWEREQRERQKSRPTVWLHKGDAPPPSRIYRK